MGLYALMGVTTPFDPESRYATSWCLPTIVFALIRLLFSLWAFITIIVKYAICGDQCNKQSFSYFTNLTYWGIAFYFLFAGLHSLTRARTRDGSYMLQRWPRILQMLHTVFYTTIVTYPFLVTIVFWTLLYKNPFWTDRFVQWENISQHALNSLAALFEIIFPRTNPPPWLHIPSIVILLALYLGLAYVTYATQHFYVYSFLNPSQGAGKTAGYIIGILVGACIIFLLVWGLIWIRRRLTDKRPVKRMGSEEHGVYREK